MIKKLRFWITKRWFPDRELNINSVGFSELIATVHGCSIAIVGNARALAQTKHGAKIDTADIVIRVNRAPMPNKKSHGTKTDWLALATSLSKPEFNRISSTRLLWMSPKRKRLRSWMTETNGFYLHAITLVNDLSEILSAPPTTGLIVIDMLRQSKAHSVDLYGFDFFKSDSLTGSRTAAQVPHDFSAEKQWVKELVDNDPRFSIHG